MSNILETLKSAVRSQAAQEPVKKKSDYELTQEELANIYFSSTQKPRNPELPMVIKVIEKQGVASVVPWIITSVAFLITAFSLFSTKRVFVDIKVIDEKNPYFIGSQYLPQQAWAPVQNTAPQSAAKEEKETFGHPEKVLLERVSFDGASRLNSTYDRATMTLVNSSVSPFARATLHFDAPMNLKGGKIVFYAKGAKGGENLGVALKDRGNVLAFDKGKINPFPRKLITEWQRAEVPVKDTLPAFDATQVTALRFEFGSNNQNKPGDTIFIKEIQVVSGQP